MIKKIDTKYKAIMPNGYFARAAEVGSAIWFYLWCVARTTKEIIYENDETRYGSVLGGMPVRVEDVRPDFPEVSDYTLKVWRRTCAKSELIRTKRAPVGIIIEVVGSVKFPADLPEKRRKWKADVGKRQHHLHKVQNDVGKTPHQSAPLSESDSRISNIRYADSQHHSAVIVELATSNKEVKGFKNQKGKEKILQSNAPIPPSDSKPKAADISKEELARAMDRLGHDNESIAARTGLPVEQVIRIINTVPLPATVS